ncbi:hypothetical protein M0802_009606 [Mischocyttarus mexicanus]|nr:hypothetical protein M0802_009606 [Mischocyttarus mexicanus]
MLCEAVTGYICNFHVYAVDGKNRGLAPTLQTLQLSRGYHEFRKNRQILLEVWNNGRRNVHMISTIHSAQ